MSDEQIIAIIAAIFQAEDSIRGKLHRIQVVADREGPQGYESYPYNDVEASIQQARDLLARVRGETPSPP